MRIVTTVCSILLIALSAVMGGCTSPGDGAPGDGAPGDGAIVSTPMTAVGPTTRPHKAQCLVCKSNADLACLDVDVDSTTPTYDYRGRTYYFCSKECRDEFAKNPARSTPK